LANAWNSLTSIAAASATNAQSVANAPTVDVAASVADVRTATPPPQGPPSRNEKIKKGSNHLRGTLKEELVNGKVDFSSSSKELLKFHGIYQQQNREKDSGVVENPTTFMIRARVPGGRLSVAQYKAFDDAAEKFGHGSIRLTTRQTIQFHWVAKGDIKGVMKELDSVLLSAQAACGDIVRNVTCAPDVLGRPEYTEIQEMAQTISDHFKSRANAYNEIWLDDQPKTPEEESDPIYLDTYLPRKFKIAVTVAGDNSVDLFTNDMSLAATTTANGEVDGYFFYAGGGAGRSHNAPETFPRQADYLGWVPKEDAMRFAEAIVTVQRDYGGRSNRKHARLKYLMADMGADWFKEQVEERVGKRFEQKKAPTWTAPNFLGWNKQHNGKWALGVHVLAGRIQDKPGYFIRSAIRHIVDKYRLSTLISPDQDIILCDVNEKDKDAIIKEFARFHVNPLSPAKAYDRAMACVALPTCGLAISESERMLGATTEIMNKALKKLGLQSKAPVLRMTGCPNGCARPYTAEIAFVGQMPGDKVNPSGYYQVYIAGSSVGTRLNNLLVEKFPGSKMEQLFEQLFTIWKNNRLGDEDFGDFTARFDRRKLNDLLTVIKDSGCTRLDDPSMAS
jgi:sulfite reductase beta subunit-like hemoprotein